MARVGDQAALLYDRLLSIADDFGLVDLSPVSLRLRAVPGRDSYSIAAIETCCAELLAVGLLRAYGDNGKRYGAITKWDQTRWAKNPKLPMPPWGEEHITGGHIARRAREDHPPESHGGNGKTKPKAEKSFEEFEMSWKTYPKKTNKQKALAEWKKLNPSPELIEKIMAALEAQKRSHEWTKEGGKYIPHAHNWIKDRRWEDEVKPDHDPGRLVI
jgi:hypothetical protein